MNICQLNVFIIMFPATYIYSPHELTSHLSPYCLQLEIFYVGHFDPGKISLMEKLFLFDKG